MLSKLIVWADTREAAINRMGSALRDYIVLGVKTNIGFLRRVMAEEEFRKGKIDTGYIERHPELCSPGERDLRPALIAAAIAMDTQSGGEQQSQAASSNWKLFARRSGVLRSPSV